MHEAGSLNGTLLLTENQDFENEGNDASTFLKKGGPSNYVGEVCRNGDRWAKKREKNEAFFGFHSLC